MVRIPGGHAPNIKNRSSKHLIPLTKHKSIYRSMSMDALAGCKDFGARQEENRRAKNVKKRTSNRNL